MSPALALDAPTERVAVNLLRHLEWQYDGFSLVFLFADVGPSLQLADSLDQRLAMQGRALHRHEAKDSFVRDPEAAVDALVDRFADLSAQPGGVWYAIQRHPGDVQWNRARTLFLARLNERRFLLERHLKRPLVLVLPAHFRAETRAMAPDIWHKRDLSEELRWLPDTGPASVQVSMAPLATLAVGDGSLPAFIEWQRMASASAAEQAFLPTAWKASDELLVAGRPGDAEHVARSALSLARRRAMAKPGGSSERDLSVSLNNLGRVAQAQDDWTQAEAVFRESLALRRQVVERLGGTPESLDDLAVLLVNVSATPPGDSAARAEAVDIYRRLCTRFPDTVRYAQRLQALSSEDGTPQGSATMPTS
ncbi:MAG: tetratricopeptide repeat protein [Candidatus Accumulibacter sp.]|uniref:Tetratricopeptide repeat protein n=1 Tax=Candidatus Accumulibacter proximus TaxID=2954385 RepID=A0A935UHT2_9PROT|nr:tetratricopeptide repeat protein [Candidatus Accumulibacter proximus]